MTDTGKPVTKLEQEIAAEVRAQVLARGHTGDVGFANLAGCAGAALDEAIDEGRADDAYMAVFLKGMTIVAVENNQAGGKAIDLLTDQHPWFDHFSTREGQMRVDKVRDRDRREAARALEQERVRRNDNDVMDAMTSRQP